jgi:hypothetical protein
MRHLLAGLLATGLLSSCGVAGLDRFGTVDWDELGLDIPIDRETGKPLLDEAHDPLRAAGTGFEARGPTLSGISGTTEVWAAPHRWYDVSTEAGMAWSASSGLTWDQKYAAWIDGMASTTSDDGWMTVEIRTPWGRTIPSPRLECAELAMFLRATFASWYGLPFYMTAWHSSVGNLHFGNFGVVDDAGRRVTGYPTYASTYKDHTATYAGRSDAEILAAWPHDAVLQGRKLTTLADDHNDWMGEGKYSGAYFDELFLNKRVGYLLLSLLTNFGSMHVADDINTFNLDPEAIREGDASVQRWEADGIGHVVVLKEIDWTGGLLQPEVMYGSMPRIQPKWYDETISRSYLVAESAGGAEQDPDGVPYSRYGGGLKRWRTPVQKSGRWMNIVPVVDRGAFVLGNDYPAIEARLVELEALMGTLTPEEQKAALLERIEVARETLRRTPASCSQRAHREDAFEELYVLMESAYGETKAEVDAEFRILEDYVYAELEYEASKTCCWNSTTSAMADIVLDYAEAQLEAGACAEPTVFGAEGGGYDRWREYAVSTGRGAQWLAWSEDESCPQRGVADDTVAATDAADFCSLEEAPAPTSGGCGGVTWEGYCDGDTVVWCQDDDLDTYVCPSHLSCGWDASVSYYWCL